MTCPGCGADTRMPCAPDCPIDGEIVSRCPACGSPMDYCQGHGEIGDPAGWAVLEAHDEGDHTQCHPEGCDQR